MSDHVPHNLASLMFPPIAQWAQNGNTVAGAANGMNGFSLNRLRRNVGIFYADDDLLYIADYLNNRLVLIAPNSTTAIRVIGPGPQPGLLNQPAHVFVTRTSIYVMDTYNFRVQKMSRNLSSIMTVAGISGVNGNSATTAALSYSYFLFVDNYDNLFVSDCGNHRVLMFPWNSTSGTNGVIVAGTGNQGAHAYQLNCPFGVFVTDDRTLYIPDGNNHRIQKWTIGGTYGLPVAGTGVAGSGLSQLYWPYTVLVDLNGYMYITDFGNHRIVRWAPDALVGECIAACSGSWGIGSNQLNGPSAITFDSNGSLYVSDYGNNRVQKFKLLNGTSIITNK